MGAATRLRALRDALGVPRERVAALAGVSVGTVANAERGSRRTTLANKRAIATALGLDVATVWPDENRPTNESTPADEPGLTKKAGASSHETGYRRS
jgi:transcriptional regulator with XRE-family HTH domain